MKLELSFAELHTPLFLNGTNWGLKLYDKKHTKGPMMLAYDREHCELLVKVGEHHAIIPTSNVVSMTPKSVLPVEVPPAPAPMGKIVAQAETPMDHVFKGLGKGKKNDKAQG